MKEENRQKSKRWYEQTIAIRAAYKQYIAENDSDEN